MCEGVAILHRGSPKDGMRQCSFVQKSQWGNEAFALGVILSNNGDRCINKAFATIFLIALEIMKPLQLCDDFQFTSSRWLISCKHALGLLSKGVRGKLTKYLWPFRKILDMLTYLFFRQTGQSQSCPCEKSRQFLQTRMLHPLGVRLVSFSIDNLQQSW